MRTYKPVSTISYVNPPTLKLLLEKLQTDGDITYWAFITHKPEGAEKVEHSHVFIEPAKQLETDNIRTFLTADGENSMPFRKSKETDWVLYGLHHKEYLEAKGEPKKQFTYDVTDFESSNIDRIWELMEGVDFFDFLTPVEKMLKCKEDGDSIYTAMKRCKIPFGAMGSFTSAWNNLDSYCEKQAVKVQKSRYFLDVRFGVSWERISDTDYFVNPNVTDEALTQNQILSREWKVGK